MDDVRDRGVGSVEPFDEVGPLQVERVGGEDTLDGVLEERPHRSLEDDHLLSK